MTDPILVCDCCDTENLYAEPMNCRGCGASLVVGDGLPTLGEEAEEALAAVWSCTCGQPSAPGVLHRQGLPCYHVVIAHEF